MLRLICSALVASALVLGPAALSTRYSDEARAEATATATEKAEKAEKKSATKGKKRELTAGQKSARERQKQCGSEWREAKKSGKLEKGATWPKYWSSCNTRLKNRT